MRDLLGVMVNNPNLGMTLGAALGIAGGLAAYVLGRLDRHTARRDRQPDTGLDLVDRQIRIPRRPDGYRGERRYNRRRPPAGHAPARAAWDEPTQPMRPINQGGAAMTIPLPAPAPTAPTHARDVCRTCNIPRHRWPDHKLNRPWSNTCGSCHSAAIRADQAHARAEDQ